MHHYIAFLRGMNLGKRRISMDLLRAHFEKLKLTDVRTFIASGNVIFSSKLADGAKLERQIEKHLKECLGYDVDTFIRTRAEIAAVAAFQPFPNDRAADGSLTVHVGFVREPLSVTTARGLVACRTDVDEFCVQGREFFWLCRMKTHESKVWTSPGLKALKLPSSTMRNQNTVRKLAALYPEI